MIVYIHESLMKSVMEVEANSSEIITVEIRLLAGDKLIFHCCYRSPGSSSENNNELTLSSKLSIRILTHMC